MELKLEIICKNFEQKKIKNNKIKVNSPSEEYYIIPLNKSFSMEYDDEVFKLSFENQLLWLKYSNHWKDILIKDFDFNECVLIKSEDILDIYVELQSNNYFRKNVWHTHNTVNVKKRYGGVYFLMLPIIEDMIEVKEFGVGVKLYQIHLITNEILLKKAKRIDGGSCNLMIPNNFLLNKEALFVRLSDNDVGLFIE